MFYVISEVKTKEDDFIPLDLIKKSYNFISVNKYSNLFSKTNTMINKLYSGIILNYIGNSRVLRNKFNRDFEINFNIFTKKQRSIILLIILKHLLDI